MEAPLLEAMVAEGSPLAGQGRPSMAISRQGSTLPSPWEDAELGFIPRVQVLRDLGRAVA